MSADSMPQTTVIHRRPVRRLRVLRPITHTWSGRSGLVIISAVVLVLIFGPALAPHAYDQLAVGRPLSPPTSGLPFGTDNLGRDVFSRFLLGGQMVLLIPLAAVALATITGGLLGMVAAYAGGLLDKVVARVFDVLLTLPPLLIALSVIAGFGSSTTVLLTTVAVIFMPQIGRVARGATLAVVTSDYVQAARARGERPLSIVVREIAPNIVGPLVSDLALRVTYGVLFVAALNFLGLGAKPPSPDWALSIASSLGYVQVQPWAALAPVVGIAALSVGLNLIADSIISYVSNDTTKDSML
ncbi:ABC transporter permease [Arthrobacter sp. ISL-30]|uniref:ABC transporter permease n=1 Tax=Arthrobacter sp. ISL-30 TaxID=2819109 RepID=UPI001BEB3395|nr:ABC transporter permease [Arthrobacter sp. ISL-30]MBT2514742.1 ABC transporter permease [Arthrobacter sp. ISL-30]